MKPVRDALIKRLKSAKIFVVYCKTQATARVITSVKIPDGEVQNQIRSNFYLFKSMNSYLTRVFDLIISSIIAARGEEEEQKVARLFC